MFESLLMLEILQNLAAFFTRVLRGAWFPLADLHLLTLLLYLEDILPAPVCAQVNRQIVTEVRIKHERDSQENKTPKGTHLQVLANTSTKHTEYAV